MTCIRTSLFKTNSSMSRRSGRSKPFERPKLLDGEDEIDENDEITRCVCGHDELVLIDPALQQLLLQEYKIKVDLGLFIQCDKCLVWQHGCCVGLFINEDVPDKYWCEQCKPDLHLLIHGLPKIKRTLYYPVNANRTRLLDEETRGVEGDRNDRIEKLTRLRTRKSPSEDAQDPRDIRENERRTRKDRRHDEFDEQLQQALRESARALRKREDVKEEHESGREDGEANSEAQPPNPDSAPTEEPHEELGQDESEGEENTHDESEEARAQARKKAKVSKLKAKVKLKARSTPLRNRPLTPKQEKTPTSVSREDLLSQLLKPRFVNEKLTIYELRKRTGAILEWLGRTQMELEEEREQKRAQVQEASFPEGTLTGFDDNLRLMENLTEKILLWEQRFGKYAP